MRRIFLILLLVLGSAPVSADGVPKEVTATIPDAAPVGAARFRWLGFTLYRAVLYTPGGARFDWQRPMALRLRYAADFDVDELTGATIDELERIEGSRSDHSSLSIRFRACYRNVVEGDRITAIATGPDAVTLAYNGARTCELSGRDIARRFLSIWLSDKSRDPGHARQLRGDG